MQIGAFEAKNRLGYLLDLVEAGEEVTITRHGRTVAMLVPMRSNRDRSAAHAAIERIRVRAKEVRGDRFDWQEWKSFRDEGRR